MNRKLFCLSLIAIAISGCSTVSKKQANGDFDYAEKSEAKDLTIPSGLTQPKTYSDFAISNEIKNAGPVGKNVDVRAPSLVLPVASSSRVESTGTEAKIWFDQVLDDQPLQAFIYDALQEQLNADGVGLDVIDADNHVYESQWYNREKESGFWLFKEIETTESFRFSFQFETKPHGRSVALIVNLVDYMKTDSAGATKTMDIIDQHRAEIAMLNQVVAQVDFKYRKQQRENRLLRANQKLVALGQNADSQPAYIVEMELDLLWSNMVIFFEDYGFTVSDLNESKKVYFVDYIQPQFSLWDKLWGDDKEIIELDDGKYQFALASMGEEGEQTSVTILEENGEPVAAEKLNEIFDVIELALSFRGN